MPSQTGMIGGITPIIGRDQELIQVENLLERKEVRLLTITGPGGAGKTRLAIEVANQLRNSFEEGVSFIALAPLTAPHLVTVTIMQALEVPESGNNSVLIDLIGNLREKHVLLVLDNFEHLMPAAQDVATLLSACPRLEVLVTSREALRLYGESIFPLQPFQLPKPEETNSLEILSQNPAVDLFVQRAAAANPAFTLNLENAIAISELCRRMDGLPLAIELAAARTQLFTPAALLKRLSEWEVQKGQSGSLKFLRGGARDLPQRQQSLQATLDWSHALLEGTEQIIFRRVAVFPGGATLEAAEAVCGELEQVLDGLSSLVGKSLLWVEQQPDGEPRFRFLKTIQDYALEHLVASGEEEPARNDQANYYMALTEKAEPELTGPDQAIWLERLEREHENLRSALLWSIDQGHIETAFRIGGSLWRFWANRGHYTEGRDWLKRILALAGDVRPEWRAKVLNGAGGLAWSQGDYEVSQRFHMECLYLRQMIEDEPGIAASLHNLGTLALFQSDYPQALAYFKDSLAIYRSLQDQWGIADQLLHIGIVLKDQRDFEEARSYLEESLSLLRDIGDTQGEAGALLTLGVVNLEQYEYGRARQFFELSRALFDSLGDQWGIALADYDLGLAALHQGDLDRAVSSFRKNLDIMEKIGDKRGIAYALEGFARIAAKRFAPERAARLAGAAKQLRERIGAPLDPVEREDFERYLDIARSQLGEKRYAALTRSGEEMLYEDAIRYAYEPIASEETTSRSSTASRKPNPAGLTSRELEVLRLVAQGLADSQIAERLFISPRTVNAHLTSIYSKLGVNSRAAATRFAVENGLV